MKDSVIAWCNVKALNGKFALLRHQIEMYDKGFTMTMSVNHILPNVAHANIF